MCYDTNNMSHGEEISVIIKNLTNLYPGIFRKNADTINTLHAKGIQDPSSLTQTEMLSLLMYELKECMNCLEEDIYDDPIEIMMNYTEPCKKFTIADAEKVISQASADGWNLPEWFTPAECVDMYKDLEPLEE